MLDNCLGAAQTIAYIEKRLYDDTVLGYHMVEKVDKKTAEATTSNTLQLPMVSLERSLYTLGCNLRMTKGVYYHITLECEGRIYLWA